MVLTSIHHEGPEPAQTTPEPFRTGDTVVKGPYHGVKEAMKGRYW